ncbi:hypothetical protein GH714_023442 [Hevea brasiliensis]|uniref:MO25-like protein n=1 Tax=Hevea brasiliensis TaxID=3981 RepID=A0A6A6LQT7_HEVBR|nr:hypothetical protein GH714_023442 [Hevea brasiliensis]
MSGKLGPFSFSSMAAMDELNKHIRELKLILYGSSDSEPVAEACAQLTQEFFKENTMHLLIVSLPKLDQDLALHYGGMLRECIRHQSITRYVLESEHIKNFLTTYSLTFDIAADAMATFKELLTRHKSTVAGFLSKNYDWFFQDFNSKLLESESYIKTTSCEGLLGEILLDHSNSAVMVRYVSSKDNLRILMNLLRESSKNIQIDAFHVFKLFAANQNKPPEIVTILIVNGSKLLRFLADFKMDREDEQFEEDKTQVVKEIAELKNQAASERPWRNVQPILVSSNQVFAS